MLGNGGVFCWYSYINPLLTQVSGFPTESVTLLMVLAGFGMVVGNLLGGRLSDIYTPGRVAAYTQLLLFMALLAIFFAAPVGWLTVLLMCLCTAGLFAVSSPQQISIIHFAKGGELLGAACVQVAFNLGNAIGAFLGGLPLEAGLDYHYPALIGATARPGRLCTAHPLLQKIRVDQSLRLTPNRPGTDRKKRKNRRKGLYNCKIISTFAPLIKTINQIR